MTPIRVLIADDHGIFLNIAARFLCQQDGLIVVGSALEGREALRLARTLLPQVAVIDLAMPDLPGLEIIKKLRAEQPNLAIVALTLLDNREYSQAALAAGADEFVPKARMTEELPAAVRRAVRGRLRAEPAGGPAEAAGERL